METGLEFVANARRQMIRLIALTVLLSGSVLLLLIAILMIITGRIASSRDIFGCSKNRQNRIVENSTYPLDDFGFR